MSSDDDVKESDLSEDPYKDDSDEGDGEQNGKPKRVQGSAITSKRVF